LLLHYPAAGRREVIGGGIAGVDGWIYNYTASSQGFMAGFCAYGSSSQFMMNPTERTRGYSVRCVSVF